MTDGQLSPGEHKRARTFAAAVGGLAVLAVLAVVGTGLMIARSGIGPGLAGACVLFLPILALAVPAAPFRRRRPPDWREFSEYDD